MTVETWSWRTRCPCGSRCFVTSSNRDLVEAVKAVWEGGHRCELTEPEPAEAEQPPGESWNLCGPDAGCTVDESGGTAGITSGGY